LLFFTTRLPSSVSGNPPLLERIGNSAARLKTPKTELPSPERLQKGAPPEILLRNCRWPRPECGSQRHDRRSASGYAPELWGIWSRRVTRFRPWCFDA
jgi:hypothetical protein